MKKYKDIPISLADACLIKMSEQKKQCYNYPKFKFQTLPKKQSKCYSYNYAIVEQT